MYVDYSKLNAETEAILHNEDVEWEAETEMFDMNMETWKELDGLGEDLSQMQEVR